MKAAALAPARAAWVDYVELTKPRLVLFVLFVVVASGCLAAGPAAPLVLLHAVCGTALVAGGGAALNMLIEREHDARMPRTWLRPLPGGRLQPRDALVFGLVLPAAGLTQLLLATTPLAAALAAATLVLYVGVYTPLKRITTLNTPVGAIPGALPALIGCAAVDGSLTPAAWGLFCTLFLWQIPHFLAIAWLYRDDYRRGGYRMLPGVDPAGVSTGRQAVLGAAALVPASLLPAVHGASGLLYLAGALALGTGFAAAAAGFARARSIATARRLLRASLLYLPLLLALLLLDLQ